MAETASKERDSAISADAIAMKSKDHPKSFAEQRETNKSEVLHVKAHFGLLNNRTASTNDREVEGDEEDFPDEYEGTDEDIYGGSEDGLTARGPTRVAGSGDDDPNDDLSPPPESPQDEESPSPMSDGPVNDLADEIVVGTNATASKNSLPMEAHPADKEMGDGDDELPVSHYPKRKRASIYKDLSEDTLEDTEMTAVEPQPPVQRSASSAMAKPGGPSVRGVLLGFWRDSPIPDDRDKHGVTGFIDIRDRLRTRIQPMSRHGKLVSDEWPIPPGPGGSWITFEKVAFDSHLVNLDHFQVKEYVKVRIESARPDETPEETQELNRKAVQEAIQNVQDNPPPETAQAPQIAYGPVIPEHAQMALRGPVDKKRKFSNWAAASGAQKEKKRWSESTAATAIPATPTASAAAALDPLMGTRPTKILLGYWLGSSEAKEENRHAVFGILGANDMFRVKVTRETRDGRRVEGNFPHGAGALWIHWHRVGFEPHLQDLSRPEVKEYVRVRQRQVDDGERPEDRAENEAQAVVQAKMRAAATQGRAPPDDPLAQQQHLVAAAPRSFSRPGANGTDGAHETRRQSSANEWRTGRRDLADSRGRHSLPDQRRTRAADDEDARHNQLSEAVDRELDRIEAFNARKAAAQPQNYGHAEQETRASLSSESSRHRAAFSQNISRINDVWSRQEAQRQLAGVDDTKYHNGLKYERKQSGAFQGKLVSQGTIITIDGEDYVEYRVLTKPIF